MSTQQLYFTSHWNYSPVKHRTIYVAGTALAQAILAAITLTLRESQQEQCLQIINTLAFVFGKLIFLCAALAPNLLPWFVLFTVYETLCGTCKLFWDARLQRNPA